MADKEEPTKEEQLKSARMQVFWEIKNIRIRDYMASNVDIPLGEAAGFVNRVKADTKKRREQGKEISELEQHINGYAQINPPLVSFHEILEARAYLVYQQVDFMMQASVGILPDWLEEAKNDGREEDKTRWEHIVNE